MNEIENSPRLKIIPPIIIIFFIENLSNNLPRKIEATAELINQRDRAPESWDCVAPKSLSKAVKQFAVFYKNCLYFFEFLNYQTCLNEA